jgi:predicted RNA-binding Zn ribbon-like protein
VPTDIEKLQDFRDGMPFLGGAPWIDLANSSFSLDGNAFDFLADDANFARWSEAAGFAVESQKLGFERQAAHRLRGVVRAVFNRLTEGDSPSLDQVGEINELLNNRTIRERLRLADSETDLDLCDHIDGPEVATRLASDLAHFLDDHEPDRLKSCNSPTCTMVFYDRGKNNRRRWCTMSICGNRDKVANFRARKSQAG